ncbi:hypothetical protein ACFWJV_29975 [Streptomyces rochei]|uniref:hypothetical protein n=1 Tax=Streptomyces TaxID=1883 RepID=UPI001E39A79A|nr:hypothetical protein [Streptomyces sp. DH1]
MLWIPGSVPALLLAVFVCVFAGVVLPAIWSAQPARRRAAAAVLAQMLAVMPGGRRTVRSANRRGE